ncbi:MAG TPA: hypothetical protein VFB34_06700 [Chloroflexota bacterium]|nr:hypothetical protein [Chloroflexota bacterium]
MAVVKGAQASLVLLVVIVIGGCGSPAARPSSSKSRPLITFSPHVTTFSGTLSGGIRLRGSLYPSIPGYTKGLGRNRITLALSRRGSRIAAGLLTLTSTMPGMAMKPDHASVRLRRGRIAANLLLPMFGSYRIQVDLRLGRATRTGVFLLDLRVPLAR